MAEMQIIAESAKIFVINNYKKIKDWSGLEISIVDSSKKETFYYNHRKIKPSLENIQSDAYSRRVEKFLNRMAKWHNPVKSVSDAVLDISDGDFSIKINGRWHNSIDKESVVVLADYIENKISKTRV